jgi:hypothetical protein
LLIPDRWCQARSNCTKTGMIGVTILVRPLKHAGVNLRISCKNRIGVIDLKASGQEIRGDGSNDGPGVGRHRCEWGHRQASSA